MLLTANNIVLKIHVVHAGVTKSIPLDLNAPIYSICEQIRSVIREAEAEQGKESKDYGLFLPHEMSKSGLWLDNMKNLAQYILKQGDILEYKYRYRWLTIKSKDDIKKTLLVDDSWSVSELMIVVCAKMGILNHEEYSLMKLSQVTEQSQVNTSQKTLSTDKELEKIKKKLNTDDDLNWLNPSQTLRQQSIEEQEILMLQRKYFFSDMNIDTRDPIQLGLLFVQLKEAILNAKHPVSIEESELLAALQCQAEVGDADIHKKKLTKISLKDCVPKDYLKTKNIEKRILKLYINLKGKDSIEAKREYCTFCRSLKTYGITYFYVKEKIKGKNKLVPRLLGVCRDRVVRLDEKSKEILKTWPLTSIRRWAGSFNAFTMDFGEYAPNEYYTAQTNKGEQISQLISGYIDIIIKHQKVEEPQTSDGFEESSVAEIKIEANKAEIVEHRSSVVGKSLEDLLHGRSPQIFTTPPIDDLSHPISNSDSQFDVTCVTSYQPSYDDSIGKTNQDDFDKVDIKRKQERITLDSFEHKVKISNSTQIVNPVNRELDSALSFATSRSICNPYSQSRNTLRSMEVIRNMNHSPDSFMTGGTQISHTVRRLNIQQQTLVRNINTNMEKLNSTKLLLDEKMDSDYLQSLEKERGKKEVKVISKEHAIQDLGSMNTEVVQVLRSSKHAPLSAANIDRTRADQSTHLNEIEKSFKIITVHFPSFVDNVRTIAEMNNSSTADEITDMKTTDTEDDLPMENSENLIEAARKLADAFSGMLNAVKPQEDERDLDFRKAILDAANRVGEASSQLFRQITSPDRMITSDTSGHSRLGLLLQNSDHEYEDTLIFLVRTVANATAHLVQTVKTVTQNEIISECAVGCQRLISPVTHAGLATSQLVTCVKILAPTINQASCTNQVLAEIQDVRESIENVKDTSIDILETFRLETGSFEKHILLTSGIEEAVVDVKYALNNLEDHLNSGISVVNFAPRIQSLEIFLTEYNVLKNILTKSIQSCKRPNEFQEFSEVLNNFIQISDCIRSEMTSLMEPDHGQDDLISQALRVYTSNQLNVIELSNNMLNGIPETMKDLHYMIDNLILGMLYEPGTRYIAHDQLIHNLYRSTQILLACSHKLITSYRQVIETANVTKECAEVIDRSEYILIVMNDLKNNPSNNKLLVSLIREVERLCQACVIFCHGIHNTIPNINDDLLIDILAVAASQTLAVCENLNFIFDCVKPIRAHLELSSTLIMINENKLEQIQRTFQFLTSPKLNLSQFLQISIAILEKIGRNVEETLPRAHFSCMFEHNVQDSSESLLLISLYNYLAKMSDMVYEDNNSHIRIWFKNIILLLYRLILNADKMLLSYGQYMGNEFPIPKCIDELLSTLYSLQSKTGNIFERIKSNILQKNNLYRAWLSGNIKREHLESSNGYDCPIDAANSNIQRFLENVSSCRQNYANDSLVDVMEQFYETYDMIADHCGTISKMTLDHVILDHFIIMSLSLLNLVQELENSVQNQEDQLLGNRISNKSKILNESTYKLQQSFNRAYMSSYGLCAEDIAKLKETKTNLLNSEPSYPTMWDKKIFFKLCYENQMITKNCSILKEIIEEKKSTMIDNHLSAISESICAICMIILKNYRPFDDGKKLLNGMIELGLQLIYTLINILKLPNNINEIKRISFILKDLPDMVSFIITSVREQMPGYKDCCSALATVTQLSHDINETEVSVASERESNKDSINFNENEKMIFSQSLYNMALSIIKIHQMISKDNLPDVNMTTCIDDLIHNLRKLIEKVVDMVNYEYSDIDTKSYSMKCSDLVDEVDKYLQCIKHHLDNIGVDITEKTSDNFNELIRELISFLYIFDSVLAKKIIEAMKAMNQDVTLVDTIENTEMANTMSGLITDDDTTILFASAGIKNSDFEKYQQALMGQLTVNGQQKDVVPFSTKIHNNASSSFKNMIHRTAEALVNDTKTLVQNSGDKQKLLANNTENVILTISNLADDCENQVVVEPKLRSEKKMLEAVKNANSTLTMIYDDKNTAFTRLTLSNSNSVLKQNNSNKEELTIETDYLQDTISDIQGRLDKFHDRVSTLGQVLDISSISNLQLNSSLEKVVCQASSVLALSSELMRMPLQKLFQSTEQGKAVSFNISNQTQATLFDFLDSLEDLAVISKLFSVRQRIIKIGHDVSVLFIKYFQILEKMHQNPNNKFVKSSLLDVFYDIQGSIKSVLQFSEELQTDDDQIKSPLRKVKFLDDHNDKKEQDTISLDPLIISKQKIEQLNKMKLDLNDSSNVASRLNNDGMSKILVEYMLKLAKTSTDVIGLSGHCRNNERICDIKADDHILLNAEIVDCIDDIVKIMRSVVYGKNRQDDVYLTQVKTIVQSVASKSAELLIIYQKNEVKTSWYQLLQTVGTDLKNITKEILSFIDFRTLGGYNKEE